MKAVKLSLSRSQMLVLVAASNIPQSDIDALYNKASTSGNPKFIIEAIICKQLNKIGERLRKRCVQASMTTAKDTKISLNSDQAVLVLMALVPMEQGGTPLAQNIANEINLQLWR